jgi:hypothetical protein
VLQGLTAAVQCACSSILASADAGAPVTNLVAAACQLITLHHLAASLETQLGVPHDAPAAGELTGRSSTRVRLTHCMLWVTFCRGFCNQVNVVSMQSQASCVLQHTRYHSNRLRCGRGLARCCCHVAAHMLTRSLVFVCRRGGGQPGMAAVRSTLSGGGNVGGLGCGGCAV